MKTASTTALEERALELLASGIAATSVANILGVDDSRISQLISQEEFATSLMEKKFERQQRYNVLDDKLDSLELQVIERLEDTIDVIHKPLELARMLQVLNTAKRRGTTAPTNVDNEKRTVVNLTMPVQIVNKFQVNAQNQVVRTEGQDLVTIQSNALEGLAAADTAALQKQILQGRVRELTSPNNDTKANGESNAAN